jgi:prefoldin beta subunit
LKKDLSAQIAILKYFTSQGRKSLSLRQYDAGGLCMKIDAETGKKIQELQVLEQNIQNLLMQKQAIQIELTEIENALSDLKKSGDEVYKIVGGILVRSNKADISSDLEEKKKILVLRISSIEKQEKIFDEKAEKFKKEITAFVSESQNKAE